MNTRPFDPPNYYYTYGSEGPEDWFNEKTRKYIIKRVKTSEIKKLFIKKNPTEEDNKAKQEFMNEYFYHSKSRSNTHIVYQFLDTLHKYASKNLEYSELEAPKLIEFFLHNKLLNDKQIDYLYSIIDIPNIIEKDDEIGNDNDDSFASENITDTMLDYYKMFVLKVLIKYDPYRSFENLIIVLKHQKFYYNNEEDYNELRFMFIEKIKNYLIDPSILSMKLGKMKPQYLRDVFMETRKDDETHFETIIHNVQVFNMIAKGISIEKINNDKLIQYLVEKDLISYFAGAIKIINIPDKLNKRFAETLFITFMNNYSVNKRDKDFFALIFKIITAGELVSSVKRYVKGDEYPGFKDALRKILMKYKEKDNKLYVSISKILIDKGISNRDITKSVMNSVKPQRHTSHKKKIKAILEDKSAKSS